MPRRSVSGAIDSRLPWPSAVLTLLSSQACPSKYVPWSLTSFVSPAAALSGPVATGMSASKRALSWPSVALIDACRLLVCRGQSIGDVLGGGRKRVRGRERRAVRKRRGAPCNTQAVMARALSCNSERKALAWGRWGRGNKAEQISIPGTAPQCCFSGSSCVSLFDDPVEKAPAQCLHL